MPPLDPLRSFLPITNPLGFGVSDFFELGLAALLVCFALTSRRFVEPWARRFAERPVWCMLLLAAAPVALRLLLLPNHPVPTPDIYDEFGHLLVADTLRHFRLANPPHALPQFFETFFVLQRPTYSSIYPVGQGLVLAIGWTLFGTPWAGVILATAAFCALCYWMLRGVDSAVVGAGRRGVSGDGIRSAVPMDEQLLGRRGDGLRRMPGIRRASAVEGASHKTRCGAARPGLRDPPADAAV